MMHSTKTSNDKFVAMAPYVQIPGVYFSPQWTGSVFVLRHLSVPAGCCHVATTKCSN